MNNQIINNTAEKTNKKDTQNRGGMFWGIKTFTPLKTEELLTNSNILTVSLPSPPQYYLKLNYLVVVSSSQIP